jgi:hypothetical protein
MDHIDTVRCWLSIAITLRQPSILRNVLFLWQCRKRKNPTRRRFSLPRCRSSPARRAFFELMTSGIREVARRLEQTEVALAAYLPAP